MTDLHVGPRMQSQDEERVGGRAAVGKVCELAGQHELDTPVEEATEELGSRAAHEDVVAGLSGRHERRPIHVGVDLKPQRGRQAEGAIA